MAVTCDVIVKREATPAQLAGVGNALWRWCKGAAGDAGIYQYLDNQALADLIAGRLPDSNQPQLEADRRGVHVRVLDDASQDRQATLDGLRRDLPADGIEDVIVDGTSWNSVDAAGHTDSGENTRPGARGPRRCGFAT